MRRSTRLLVPVLVAISLAPVAPAAAIGTSPGPHWRPCHRLAGPSFECTKVQVPLDYDDPLGDQIGLSLVRLPASDPAARIGSIFVNPGGPGGSGVDMVLAAAPFLFGDDVRARFDIVGFDPRGIIRSNPLLCFGSFEEALGVFPPFAFPMTADEEALVASLDTTLDEACRQSGGAIQDHMATADVARDLDRLRQAVGDDRLTYVGYSYGSFLGVTYANLFPERVRAVVVDGVLDPIAWTTGRDDEASTLPFSTRLRSDAGAMATLNEFFRLCDEAGTDGCAFAGDSAARFAALADRLRSEPIEIVDPVTGETFVFTYADLIGNALSALYDSASWQAAAQLLAEIESLASPLTLGRALNELQERTGLAPRRDRPVLYPNFVEGFPGVACSDSVNPDGHGFWSTAGAESDAQFGYFGRIWTWASSSCAVWEGVDEDRYLGPFDHQTASPVLVVGNLFDPATRYEGAVTVHDLLPNSSLLTVAGWGHTSLFLSACADQAVARYLLDGTAPPPGTVCTQDVGPFDVSSSQVTLRQSVRAEVMSEVAYVPPR
jgi:pimeloyl-ACP methyl ester carboxylesterase